MSRGDRAGTDSLDRLPKNPDWAALAPILCAGVATGSRRPRHGRGYRAIQDTETGELQLVLLDITRENATRPPHLQCRARL